MTGNFDKRQTPVDATDFPYDYGSVMHYSSTAFGWPGSKTIEAKVIFYNNKNIFQLNDLFNCENKFSIDKSPH